MTWIVIILTIIAAAASAAGSKMQANAVKDAADFNEDANKKNAQAAAEQAAFDAENIRSRNRRVLAGQRAAFSASGVDPDSGSPLDVRKDTAAEGEMDALIAIYTGQANNTAYKNRAALNRMEANAARRGGNINTASSLLNSGSSFASNPSFGSP